MPNDLEINCTILINSKRGYRLNKIMDEKKIQEMLQKLFDKTNTLLEEKMTKIESSVNNVKSDVNTVRDDLKNDINRKDLTSQKIRPKQSLVKLIEF